MSAESLSQSADLTTAGSTRWTGSSTHERNFYIALACAVIIHCSAFVGAFVAKPKELGDPSGQENAISVSLVTEADLQSRSTIAEPPAPPPSPVQPPHQATPPPKPESQPQPVEQPPQPPEPPQPEAKDDQPETPPPPAPDETKPAEQQEAKLDQSKPEDKVPDLFSLSDQNPEKMKSEAETKPKSEEAKPTPSKSTAVKPPSKPKQKPKQKKLSSLDLTTPDFADSPASGGRSAAFQRPPGITKSGLNDAFARAVIRALQMTMPQLQETLGRVTVRIFLSETGNVTDVKVIHGSSNSSLNQSVLFAAKQTSYPIPPTGSNEADRTFMVTYIYD